MSCVIASASSRGWPNSSCVAVFSSLSSAFRSALKPGIPGAEVDAAREQQRARERRQVQALLAQHREAGAVDERPAAEVDLARAAVRARSRSPPRARRSRTRARRPPRPRRRRTAPPPDSSAGRIARMAGRNAQLGLEERQQAREPAAAADHQQRVDVEAVAGAEAGQGLAQLADRRRQRLAQHAVQLHAQRRGRRPARAGEERVVALGLLGALDVGVERLARSRRSGARRRAGSCARRSDRPARTKQMLVRGWPKSSTAWQGDRPVRRRARPRAAAACDR